MHSFETGLVLMFHFHNAESPPGQIMDRFGTAVRPLGDHDAVNDLVVSESEEYKVWRKTLALPPLLPCLYVCRKFNSTTCFYLRRLSCV